MSQIQNYIESWNNHTGDEVQLWINGELQSNKNRSIVQFGEAEIEGTSVTIKGKNAAGEVVDSVTFNTVAQATATVEFSCNIDESSRIVVGKGNNIVIPYTFEVKEGITNISGCTAKIIYTINGKPKEVDGIKSIASSRPGTLIIDSSEFKVGDNTLVVLAYTIVGVNERTSTVTAGSFDVTILDLKLSVEVSPEHVNSQDEEFTITPIVTNAGRAFTDNITYKIKYGSDQAQLFKVNSNTFTINSFKGGQDVTIPQLPLQFIAVYNDNQVYSNMCKVEIMDKSFDGEAVNIDNVEGSIDTFNGQGTINDVINAVQYSTKLFTFDVNRLNSTEITPTVTYNDVTSMLLTLTIDGLGKISFMYTFRNAGVYVIKVGATGHEHEITVNVSELNVNLREPVDYIYSATVNDQDWDGVSTGIDNIGNGWKNGMFVLNNGALFLANCTPYSNTGAYTISLKYKVENGIDESETLISCINSNKTMGFEITPNKIKLVNGTVLNQIIDDSETHEVTLVYYDNNCGVYSNSQVIFVDGLYQCISAVGSIVRHDFKIQCTATNATLFMQGIKVFNRALSFIEVQSLYAFNSGIDIADYVNQNNIFTTNSVQIGRQEIDIDSVPNGAKVLVLSGEEINNQTPWYIINSFPKDEDYKGYKIPLTSMRLYVQGDDENPRNFLAIGGCMSAQGTSSMAYPIKNFRIYWNKDSDAVEGVGKVTAMYLGVAHDWVPQDLTATTEGADKGYQLFKKSYGDDVTKDSSKANRFCLKADFAESSGIHNTGFARLAEYLLDKKEAVRTLTPVTGAAEESGIPPQKEENYNYDVRENVDGQPIYLFFYNETLGTYEYGGRYNMNNDKSNVKVFGFEGVDDYIAAINEQNTEQTLNTKAIGIDNNFSLNHYSWDKKTKQFKENSFNPTECWEFSSNDGINKLIGGFSYGDAQTTFNLTSGQDPVFGNSSARVWLNGTWEYRYPDYDEASPADENYRTGLSKPYYLYQVYNFLYEHNQSISAKRSQAKLNEFAEQLHLYFNVNNVLKYFVLTHWFACLDLRIKNCMLAFYADPYTITEQERKQSPLYNVRGYWLFYDNDTILGLNNAGEIAVPWDFYETDTQNGFPGVDNHGLWYNLLKCYELYVNGQYYNSSAWKLGSLIPKVYQSLREATSNGEIEQYLNSNYPDAIHNIDLEIKYLNSEKLSGLGTGKSYAKAQGYRNIHRNLWFTKRTTWLDNIYGANVSKNMLQYKVDDTNSANSGYVILTKAPQYRFWKFYSSSEGAVSYDVTLNSDIAGNLQVPTGLTTSSFCQFMGLNGAKTIDFSNYEFGNMSADVNTAGKFPYLTSLVIRKVNGSNVRVRKEHFSGWIKPEIAPNLEELYLCNLKSNEGFEVLDLSGFNKLHTVDTRGTAFGKVQLSDTSVLTHLYLESPTYLNLVNKPNLENFSIVDGSNLVSVYISNVGSSVYKQVLGLIRSNMESATVIFGTSADNRYEISKAELDLLVNLPNNANVSGFVYYPEQYENKDLLDVKFPNLSISDTLSTEGAVLSFNGALEEGKSLKINCNVKVTTWEYTIDGQVSNLNGLINYSNTNYSITFIAALNNSNEGFTKSLVVRANFADGTHIDSDVINIKYVPIREITLIPENNGFTTTAEAGIITTTVAINNDSTKAYLLNDNNNSNITASLNEVPQNVTYENGLLKNIQCSVSEDSILTVSIFGVTNSVNLQRNIQLVNTTSAESSLQWLVRFKELTGGTTLSASEASTYNIDLYWSQILAGLISSNENIPTLNFEYLKYFGSASNAFVIPGNVPFTNLSTPRGVNNVEWTSANYTTYETITFNKYVSKVYISLSFDNQLPSGLILDLSRTKITKILNNGTNNTENNVANVSITATMGSLVNPVGSTNGLFVYPETLQLIGNDVDVTSPFNAIFNWSISGVGRIYMNTQAQGANDYYKAASLYYLGTLPESILTVGVVASYNLSNMPFNSLGNVKNLYGFYAFNNTSSTGIQNLNTLKNIGRFSFYNTPSHPGTIQSSFGQVETIGSYAFWYLSGEGAITTASFPSVRSIGTNAFVGFLYNLSLTFSSNLTSIAAGAFINFESNITYTIDFGNKESAFAEPLQDFIDTSKSGKYVLRAKAGSDLYNQLVLKFGNTIVQGT